ncbi:metal ABC transporter substrate-binding protein [Streptomyces lichenis]|uniref:Metal ABC transporter substrate-binding protein n=1 Tax=Streptomyces lichenis TaxID=2306967 RepID=A0ABT0I6J2_9ACTN|nr:metal ABC transporter substrate-binding protein [Streptomyces lichenis]MCK8676942.1 metal ABC transporter substrate-binding protein [Streptomyces lichenis]
MRVRRSIPSAPASTTAVAAAVALGLLTLTACGGSDSGTGAGSDGKVDVVASFYPMQFLAERIGGTHVEVTTLTQPGVEPHDLELKPRQIGQLGEADYVLYLKGLQPAADEAIDQSEAKTKVDAGSLTTLEEHGASTEGHGHEHGDEHSEEEGHGEEGHEHEGGTDPHVWLDPVKYAEIAKGVGDSLAKADPDHAADYRKNTAALVKELTALDTAYASGLKNTSTRTFITTHAAFGYLAERYGLDQEGISGVSPEAEPSPARIKELQSIARKDKVGTVFFETLASDRTAKTLARDTGLKTAVLDPLEGITDRSKGDDYLQVMRSNLTALKQALGAR